MSTFFFKSDVNSIAEVAKLKEYLDKAKDAADIDNWQIHPTSPDHLLEIETTKLSSKQVEHMVREAGFDVAFTLAPQARGKQ
jgi:hypothetical protein